MLIASTLYYTDVIFSSHGFKNWPTRLVPLLLVSRTLTVLAPLDSSDRVSAVGAVDPDAVGSHHAQRVHLTDERLPDDVQPFRLLCEPARVSRDARVDAAMAHANPGHGQGQDHLLPVRMRPRLDGHGGRGALE